MPLERRMLESWQFAMGDSPECLEQGRMVQVPHTWSTEEEGQFYVGKSWYRTACPPMQPHERIFLRFRGVYRDARVYVNGKKLGAHDGSGYTPFMVEATPGLVPGQPGEIAVSVTNIFSQAALPFDRSFDWANDGGIYRPVEWLRTGMAVLRDMVIQAEPVILPGGRRQDRGAALFGFQVNLDGIRPGMTVSYALHEGAEDSVESLRREPLLSGTMPAEDHTSLTPQILESVRYWHFDWPQLYTLRLCLYLEDGSLSDVRETVIGFRKLTLQGGSWLLNGEAVRLPGMEWMPGSDPAFGMAESKEKVEQMLRLLRESNSILTRFHWQQDDWVFDYCDRHGLLVQEEIPFWGKQPEGDPEVLWPCISMQLMEMIRAHRHHPSIIAWGVGNELSGQTWPVQHYVRKAKAYAYSLDPTRPVNYVTNTALHHPRQDAAGEGDVLMINDYIGTWHEGLEQNSAWEALLHAYPGRAFVPSEFGLCEPAFSGGDQRRGEIFMEKMTCYRSLPQIAGTIYFCLNDYRTHMGEEGDGRLRRRVHGSADLYGGTKPSYGCVQREYAPLRVQRTQQGLLLTCREDIPYYRVRGYILAVGNDRLQIPDLEPGEHWLYMGPMNAKISILRPNGDLVLKLSGLMELESADLIV